MELSQHDPNCPHSNKVKRILDPQICTYCEVIRKTRQEYA